jgi:hypothetical protein
VLFLANDVKAGVFAADTAAVRPRVAAQLGTDVLTISSATGVA